MADIDLKAEVDRHDREIVAIRSDLSHVSRAVDDIKKSQSQTNEKIDSLVYVIQRKQNANLSDMREWLQTLLMVFALAGGIVSGIVYISNSSNSADMALLKYKLEQMRMSFGWKTEVKPAH